jgi:hypothetical protein
MQVDFGHSDDILLTDDTTGNYEDIDHDNLDENEDLNIGDLSKVYYRTTRSVPHVPYEREKYLKECNHRSKTAGPFPKLNFIITKVETQYPPNIIHNFYQSNYRLDSTNHFLIRQGKQDGKFKDMIFVRGRTIPTIEFPKSKTVLAYVDYKLPYGPKIYLEAREGFDDCSTCSYEELSEISQRIDPAASVTNCRDGVSKFIRWIQNYLFVKLNQQKESLNMNGSKNDYSKQRVYFDPNCILSYTYLYNIPGYKSVWGRIPDPEEGGPDRHIIEVFIIIFSKKILIFF